MTFRGTLNALRNRLRYIALGVTLVALLAVSGPLVLDADEADLRYDRNSIPASRLDNPKPGDAYAFDHSDGKFNSIKLCTLHVDDEYPLDRVKFAGINDWGIGVNSAITNVGAYVGEVILAGMQLQDSSVVWEFNKTYRKAELNTQLQRECATKVADRVRMPDQSVFIVDMVYYEVDKPDLPKMVQLSRSTVLPKDCGESCLQSVPMYKVLKVGWVTRIKAEWELVRIE